MTHHDLFHRAHDLLRQHVPDTRHRAALLTDALWEEPDLRYSVDYSGAPNEFATHCLEVLWDARLRDGGWAVVAVLRALPVWEGEIAGLVAEFEGRPPLDVMAEPKASPPQTDGRSWVFVSYAHADTAIARKLVEDLEVAGHRCWVDWQDIGAGEPWMRAIEAGLRPAYAMICVLSQHANGRDWLENELAAAKDWGIPVVPVRVEDCERPLPLKHLQAEDLFGLGEGKVCARYLPGWTGCGMGRALPPRRRVHALSSSPTWRGFARRTMPAKRPSSISLWPATCEHGSRRRSGGRCRPTGRAATTPCCDAASKNTTWHATRSAIR